MLSVIPLPSQAFLLHPYCLAPHEWRTLNCSQCTRGHSKLSAMDQLVLLILTISMVTARIYENMTLQDVLVLAFSRRPICLGGGLSE